MSGRFAPSPTGRLHIGNLRTALVAWLAARSDGRGFLVRIEDLDPVNSSREVEAVQLADLAAIGLDWDGIPVRQSERFTLYEDALADLSRRDLLYPCYCTRREIREAASAPHGDAWPEGHYPGICRQLSAQERAAREEVGRRPALRLRAQAASESFDDAIVGAFSGPVDDVVVRRNDGVPAYNLAVVVDDAGQGVTQVVRGDDLLDSTPRQVHLQVLLGLRSPQYAHVPLALGPDGARLAKRHGAVTLGDLADAGMGARQVVALLGASLGLCAPEEVVTAGDLLPRFSFAALPRQPWSPGVGALSDTMRAVDDEIPAATPPEFGNDLRRILGYEGATADDSEYLRCVGPELFVTRFWTETFCATIIRAAEATGAFAPQPDDPVPGHEVSLAVISPRLFEAVQEDLGVRIWPRLQTEWPYIDYAGLRDVFVIRYALGEQEELRIHHDIAQVSASVKLNAGYDGGELDFPRQGFTNAQMAVGDLLAWPSLVTHPHRTNRLTRGVKYALTIWFELPSI